MKHLVLAVCVLAASIAGAATKRASVKVVDGKQVFLVRPLKAGVVIETSNVRFYDCLLAKSRTPCTVITGNLVSHLPTANFVVTLTFEFHDRHPRRGTFHQMGSAKIEITRPTPGEPVKFVGIGPDCIRSRDMDPVPDTFSGYTVSVQIKPFKPKRAF